MYILTLDEPSTNKQTEAYETTRQQNRKILGRLGWCCLMDQIGLLSLHTSGVANDWLPAAETRLGMLVNRCGVRWDAVCFRSRIANNETKQ